ncbi:MAG TPA: NUDIX domain-containing protein, partial [Chitinophagaceae bacterium]|nr:NUDIX domain-containing protein [Chitinophagaceae bacterium]
NDSNEILLIFRNGFWDLPKGKLEPSEAIENCALREVQEETGLNSITIKKNLTTTYHTYHLGTKFILKESHWYKMKATKNENPVPQTDEGITEINWVHAKNIEPYLSKTYPSVVDVIRLYLQ